FRSPPRRSGSCCGPARRRRTGATWSSNVSRSRRARRKCWQAERNSWWSRCRCRRRSRHGSRASWPSTRTRRLRTSASAASMCRKARLSPRSWMATMSDEGFLKRWSRKKRTEPPAAEKESAELPPSNPSAGSGQALPSQTAEGSPSVPPQPAAAPNEEEEAIDPATLPSIESLGPASDYTVFLKKGVPEALRLAALRKAWMSDPFIRDFRSPAIDYGWDFTTPEYSLRAGDDVGKMLEKIFPPATAEGGKPE